MSLPNFISNEKQAIRKEWPSLITPILVFAVIVYLLLCKSEDSLAQNQITFEVPVTGEWVIPWTIPPFDLNRLAYAVSMAETGNCTLGYGKTHNNAVGIRRKGKFIKYPTCEASKEDFKRTWMKYYHVVYFYNKSVI